jgi:hypothetical protein
MSVRVIILSAALGLDETSEVITPDWPIIISGFFLKPVALTRNKKNNFYYYFSELTIDVNTGSPLPRPCHLSSRYN